MIINSTIGGGSGGDFEVVTKEGVAGNANQAVGKNPTAYNDTLYLWINGVTEIPKLIIGYNSQVANSYTYTAMAGTAEHMVTVPTTNAPTSYVGTVGMALVNGYLRISTNSAISSNGPYKGNWTVDLYY